MEIPDRKSKDLYCLKSKCKGVLLVCDCITTAYNWALPLQCNRCKTVRFMCKECVAPRKFGGKYILHKQYLWRHNSNHTRNKDFSESKSDSNTKSIDIVPTDNKPNTSVNNGIVSDSMDIVRTVDEQASHNVNSDFVGEIDFLHVTSDIVHV